MGCRKAAEEAKVLACVGSENRSEGTKSTAITCILSWNLRQVDPATDLACVGSENRSEGTKRTGLTCVGSENRSEGTKGTGITYILSWYIRQVDAATDLACV